MIETPIFKQIEAKRKVSKAYGNEIKKKIDEILMSHSTETLYFIHNKFTKTDEKYSVYKYENGEAEVIALEKDKLPQNSGVNSILRLKNGEYILDEEVTENVQNEIMQMAEEVLNGQDKELDEYRKENHLYMVEEKINDRVFLIDITEKVGYSLEEVNFPEELLPKAHIGATFEYKNGKYEYNVADGLERICAKQE